MKRLAVIEGSQIKKKSIDSVRLVPIEVCDDDETIGGRYEIGN